LPTPQSEIGIWREWRHPARPVYNSVWPDNSRIRMHVTA
jgi:hypothetical protein